MNVKKIISYFKMYIKSIYKQIINFIVIICCFFISAVLYDSLIPAVMYAMFVTFFIESIYLIVEFIKFYSKYSFLQRELNNSQLYMEISSFDNFDNNEIEKTYQKILLKLQNNIIEFEKNMNDSKQEQEDYYALWVHDIKTPLFALDLLIKNRIGDINTRLQFQQELLKIQQYVDMVLQYLRISTLSGDLSFKNCSLHSVVNDVVKKFSIIFINKNLELKLDNFQCDILSDRKWLTFVLEQILSNSLKYTYRGYIEIAYDKVLNSLNISDTGIGIAPEDQKRIFEKSFTGYNGRIDKNSTGMGLYLCKLVCDMLGIKITVKSIVGEGTTFSLLFIKENIEIY